MNCKNCKDELIEVQGGVGHKSLSHLGTCLCGCFHPEKEEVK